MYDAPGSDWVFDLMVDSQSAILGGAGRNGGYRCVARPVYQRLYTLPVCARLDYFMFKTDRFKMKDTFKRVLSDGLFKKNKPMNLFPT